MRIPDSYLAAALQRQLTDGKSAQAPSRLEQMRKHRIYQDVPADDHKRIEQRQVKGRPDPRPIATGRIARLVRRNRADRARTSSKTTNTASQERSGSDVAQEAKQELLSGRYHRAFSLAKQAAEMSDPFGMSLVGFLLRDGIGVVRDEGQAVGWLKRGAEAGQVDAMVGLGRMYAEGRGTNADNLEALAWFRRAAERGHPSGMHCLALMHWKGWGVARDSRRALHWFRQAARRGQVESMKYLAFAHRKGLGVSENMREAAKWYRIAADLGDANAQYHLGSMHISGRGVMRDRIRAHAWLSLAAINGQTNAIEVRDRVADLMTPAEILEARELALEMQRRIS